ncbi:MAG: hypothetical protein H6774_02880 [Pseudomonadales bacterium]|nr:hypothetical protein [Candidatus Woesebacteria bacterium]MCB9802010.1 hypothetical protein [Pseudomonadales bacterium]
MEYLVPAKNHHPAIPGVLRLALAAVAIYSMVFPLVVMDAFLFFYQKIFFGFLQIPQIDRDQYVKFDRWNMTGLDFFQRVHCAYCDYANGLIDFARAVTRQTEIHTCAIQYSDTRQSDPARSEYLERKRYE